MFNSKLNGQKLGFNTPLDARQSRRRWVRSCSWCPQLARKILLPFHPAWMRGQKKAKDKKIVAAKSGQFTASEAGKGQFLWRTVVHLKRHIICQANISVQSGSFSLNSCASNLFSEKLQLLHHNWKKEDI